MNLDTLDVESARFDILTTGVRPISRNAMPGRKWLADPGFQLGAPVPLRLTSKFRLVFCLCCTNERAARPSHNSARVCACYCVPVHPTQTPNQRGAGPALNHVMRGKGRPIAANRQTPPVRSTAESAVCLVHKQLCIIFVQLQVIVLDLVHGYHPSSALVC